MGPTVGKGDVGVGIGIGVVVVGDGVGVGTVAKSVAGIFSKIKFSPDLNTVWFPSS
jgi:F0F1-type ATP synthase membrane subunit c/vacuolar-type H+-ATPase subunit K